MLRLHKSPPPLLLHHRHRRYPPQRIHNPHPTFRINSRLSLQINDIILLNRIHNSALSLKQLSSTGGIMDEMRDQFLEQQIEVEIEGENFLLARHELVEIDRVRNTNREALTALRKRAKTTKSSVPPPFESLMKGIDPRPLVKEICATCGHHDATENTLLMFPGTDTFAAIPFHAAHTILEEDQARLDFDSKKLQSNVKEISLSVSEKGALSDKISPGVLRSLVALTDNPKIEEKD